MGHRCVGTLALIYLLLPATTLALNLEKCRQDALGMESLAIRDDQLSASSSFDEQSVGPQNGRIRTERASGAWCPKQLIRNGSYEFLQISLANLNIIRGVETQGRFGNGTGREFTPFYFIDYWHEGMEQWARYRNHNGIELLEGNSDTVNVVYQRLDPPLIASKIRLVPYSMQTRTTCLRAELYGCSYKERLLGYVASPSGVVDTSLMEGASSAISAAEMASRHLLLMDGHISRERPRLLSDLIKNSSASSGGATETDGLSLKHAWLGWSRLNVDEDNRVNITFFFLPPIPRFSHVTFFAYAIHPPRVLINGLEITAGEGTEGMARDGKGWHPIQMDLPLPGVFLGNGSTTVQLSLEFFDPWLFLTEIAFELRSTVPINPTESAVSSTVESSASASSTAATVIPSPDTVLEPKQLDRLNHISLVIFALSATGLLCISFLIALLTVLARRRSETKLGTASAEGSFYSKLQPSRLIATMGNNGAVYSSFNGPSNCAAPITNESFSPYDSKLLGFGSGRIRAVAEMRLPRPEYVATRELSNHSYSSSSSSGSSSSPSSSTKKIARSNEPPPSLKDISFPPPPTFLPRERFYGTAINPQAQGFIASESGTAATTISASSDENTADGEGMERGSSMRLPWSPSSPLLRSQRGNSLTPLLKNSTSASAVNDVAVKKPVPKPRLRQGKPIQGASSYETGVLTLPPRMKQPCTRVKRICAEPRIKGNRMPVIVSLDSIELGEILNEGKFTRIHLCRYSALSVTKAVIKMSKYHADDSSEEAAAARQALIAEAELMQNLNHVRIVKLLGTCLDHSLLSEYVGEDIRSFVRSSTLENEFSYEDILGWCVQIAEGMQFLESKGLVHGHLSPRSCLLDFHREIKIASPRGPNLHAQLRYSAPEAVIQNRWSHASDAWSFAIVVWEMIHHFTLLPFQSLTNAQLVRNFEKILSPENNEAIYLELHRMANVSVYGVTLVALIERCWSNSDLQRPGFAEIHRQLSSIRARDAIFRDSL